MAPGPHSRLQERLLAKLVNQESHYVNGRSSAQASQEPYLCHHLQLPQSVTLPLQPEPQKKSGCLLPERLGVGGQPQGEVLSPMKDRL